jgi:MOSC domain-containing protein YiiM
MGMVEPIVLSVQVGRPAEMGDEGADDPWHRPWFSGIVKRRADGPLWLGRTNLDGDGQADLENHGGPDKAVLAYSASHYPGWREELGRSDLPFGAFGENFTVDGLDERGVCIGDVFALGDARLQVSQPRQPCWKLARLWQIKDLTARVQRTGRGGWYLRVLAEGRVAAGQAMTLQERPRPRWTVALANDLLYRRLHDPDEMAALAASPLLAASWREQLQSRLEKDGAGAGRR